MHKNDQNQNKTKLETRWMPVNGELVEYTEVIPFCGILFSY